MLPELVLYPLTTLACLVVGYLLRQGNVLKDKHNQLIPIILAFLGIIVSVWVNKAFDPETIIYGALSGVASTGLNEAFKNFIETGKKEGD